MFMEKVAIKIRIKPPKKRNPSQRLKARLYYRRNRSKIRVQRRRYMRSHKSVLKHRKLFKRFKPKWFKGPKKLTPKTKKRLKFTVPKTKSLLKTEHKFKMFK